jgi:peptide/nickel transport system substrate-binding protein
LLLAAAPSCRRPAIEELRAGFASTLSSLDPHRENTIAAVEQLGNVYEPLVALDSAMRVRPSLAASWSSPDAVTWVFRLRPSVVFHDGSPLTPADVVYSLSRPRLDARLEASSYLATVADVRASGHDRVVVKTRGPDALLLANLAFVSIVRAGATTEALDARPNGTGPWRVVDGRPGESLRLLRSSSYWGPRPAFPLASVDFGITEEDAVAGVAAGRWHLVRYSSSAVEDAARSRSDWGVVTYPNVFLRHLAFDVARDETPFCPGIPNPFRQPAVREAISLALDRTALATRVGPDATPASQLVPPAIFGYSQAAPPLERDLGRARALLASAGFPEGFDVVLHRSGYSAAADEVRRQLAEVGIRVTVAPLKSTEFFAALNRRELSFWIVADGSMSGDALETLLGSFRSPDPALGIGLDNYGGYRNPDLDRTIAEALGQIDPARRLPVLQAGLKAALEDFSWVPLYFSREALLVRRPLAYEPRADGLVRLADVGYGN